jgi:HSP20 family protein
MHIETDPINRLRPLSEEQLRSAVESHGSHGATAPLAYDVYRMGDEMVIAFDVPGATPDDVELDIDGPWLTVKVERGVPTGHRVDLVHIGRHHGTFSHRLFMGHAWDLSKAQAVVRDGVLEVRAPVVVSASRRRLRAGVGGSESLNGQGSSLDVHATEPNDARQTSAA